LALVLHDEGEDVPLLLAAEAVEEALGGVDVERRRLLGVEGTESLVALPRLAQLHVLADHRHDVGPRANLADDVLGDHPHDSSGAPARWRACRIEDLNRSAHVSMSAGGR